MDFFVGSGEFNEPARSGSGIGGHRHSLKPEFQGKVGAEDFKQYLLKCAQEGKLPKYAVPDRFELVNEIPKTSVGKLDKKVLRQTYDQ
jgi:acyl-CoA synthetase (AMP-forming)/AMP-acid ligase II